MTSLSDTQRQSNILSTLSKIQYCCRTHFSPPVAIGRPVREDDLSSNSVGQTEPTGASDEKTSPDALHQRRGILDIPIEILAEICTYLEPLDLRSISLTNQGLRRVLMSRESKQIWKLVRRATYDSMPECPDGMSEPQYVQFLFDLYCFTCDEVAHEIDMINRVKSCARCYLENHLTTAEATQMYREFPCRFLFPAAAAVYETKRYFYRPRMQADHDRLKKTLKVTPSECAAFEAAQVQKTQQARETADVIIEWMYNECRKQQHARHVLYERRRISIREKMVELGYDSTDITFVMEEIQKLHDVTEEEWVSMRSALAERAERNKVARLKEESEQDDEEEVDDEAEGE